MPALPPACRLASVRRGNAAFDFLPHAAGTRGLRSLVLALALFATLSACAAPSGPLAPTALDPVEAVDLDRFMGRWYVVENIGLAPEANAFDETEDYARRDDGRIDVTFRYRDGSFEAPIETLTQVGWVVDTKTNAEWRVRPFWPLALGYRIVALDPDYAWTIVDHPSKRWVWIMARTPSLPADLLDDLRRRLEADGYDVARLRRVPQRPLSERAD